ncbi:unnamed protein product [Phytophthora fragariaefolia]|uniref:Unnamed protein product n=1 Tax=Phytophthora fragariaefolia TaxID=1490495 RepID=A0A9W6XM67_9STRA|nr:unnamed protein product [Phytophthora fragariaefolia]
MENPQAEHWIAVKRIFRYLQGTKSHGIRFSPGKDIDFQGYSDADWAGDHSDRKSTSGYLFQVTGGPISWGSKKQSSVSLSTSEAEYIALSLAIQEGKWVHKLLYEILTAAEQLFKTTFNKIDCNAPRLTLLRQKDFDRLRIWPDHDLVHDKLDWNGSADRLASAALQRQAGIMVEYEANLLDLVTLNRLDEILRPEIIQDGYVARVVPVTTGSRAGSRLGGPGSGRFGSAPNSGLKTNLAGRIQQLTQDEAKSYSKMSMDYDVDLNNLLYYCPPTKHINSDRDRLMKLVVPETLQQDVLHHYHVSLEGGHQGIGRTHLRIRSHFHWGGLHPATSKLHTPFRLSRWIIYHPYPSSFKGNTELLIWVDLFSGYIIAKASGSRTAQTIAESYEECVFRRFDASEVIRHDREPGFMADLFRSFNWILGQRQRATMAYRPQANGTAARMVQTATRALKMYIRDLDQRDWDDYAERLSFAINTAQDRIRGETPFYVVHGWDPRSTLEATIPVGSTRRQDRDPRRWRCQIQRQYQQARAQINERLRRAIADRADSHNETAHPHQIEAGSRVWLYLDRVKEGLFPVVHVSKLKLVKNFPDRPQIQLNPDVTRRLDFDESLLPEDSWIQDLGEDEF